MSTVSPEGEETRLHVLASAKDLHSISTSCPLIWKREGCIAAASYLCICLPPGVDLVGSPPFPTLHVESSVMKVARAIWAPTTGNCMVCPLLLLPAACALTSRTCTRYALCYFQHWSAVDSAERNIGCSSRALECRLCREQSDPPTQGAQVRRASRQRRLGLD